VFQARIFTFGVLTDDSEVDIGMTGRKAGERFAEDNGGIDVELLTHGDVPGDVARLGDRGKENAWR
jgi:hypothetical protein